MAAKKKIKEATFATGQKAVNFVKRIVEESWYSKWIPIEGASDDGIDGIVFLHKKLAVKRPGPAGKIRREYTRKPTGGVIYIQVKGGEGYRSDSKAQKDHVRVNVGKDYISSHRPRWNLLRGPAILVYVDTESKRKNGLAWWTDLKDESSYSKKNKQVILLPKRQTFGSHSKGELRRLSSRVHPEGVPPKLEVPRELVNNVPLRESTKVACRREYRYWAKSSPAERHHNGLGEVLVTRVGWRHMTRKGRRRSGSYTRCSSSRWRDLES